MSKIPKLARSWRLCICALRLVARQKRLLWFPILNGLCCLLLAVLFMAPMIARPTGHTWGELAHWKAVGHLFLNNVPRASGHDNLQPTRLAYGYFAAIYLPLVVCGTFFNVAFYHQVMKALAGEQVGLRAGLNFACRRWRAILGWSLFAGVIGLLIQLLAERLGWAARLGLRLTGMAWSLASVFVIPVMIREEDANPLSLLRRSAAAVRRTWGESLAGFVGIQFGLALVLPVVLLAGIVVAIQSLSPAFEAAAFPVMLAGYVLMMFVLMTCIKTFSHIYRCALYIYASEGVVPEPFSEEQMHQAWKVRAGGAS